MLMQSNSDFLLLQDTVVAETRDAEHAIEMMEELKKNFEDLSFTGKMAAQTSEWWIFQFYVVQSEN